MSGPNSPNSSALLAFVGTQILPHEADVRRWLATVGVSADDRDDILQEVYCRLLMFDSIGHIGDPRVYLFKAARRVMLQRLERNRVVPILSVQSLEQINIADGAADPEMQVSSRAELSHVLDIIRQLPERCRQIFILRKVHGYSQAETAARLRVTENIVEKETAKGLDLILRDLARDGFANDRRARRRKPVRHVHVVD
jgi:RNA polymerase sigma-70 factor (ECF subfamily)